jgi:integrase
MRVYDHRHAYAIKLAEGGTAMHFISEVLGHSSTEFTREQYARFSRDSASRAVLKVLKGGENGTKLTQAVSQTGSLKGGFLGVNLVT